MRNEKEARRDSARLGLVREILEVVLGLEKETEDRVMRLIRGSVDSADVRTPEMRQRIGPRAMRYLRNAIDLARSEGGERHEDDPDLDLSKDADVEPGHMVGKERDHEEAPMGEGFSFKDFLLNEVTAMVDTDDPDAMAKLKQKQRVQDPRRLANINASQAQDEQRRARENPESPTAGLETQAAKKKQELAQIEKRLAAAKPKDVRQ